MKRTPDEWLCLARAQQERFWAKVNKHGPAHPTIAGAEQCWVWTGGVARGRGGYGKFSITAPTGEYPKQRHVRAHRMSWEFSNHALHSDVYLLHSCDNPACVNPAHLRPGTAKDNYDDARSRARNTAKGRAGYRAPVPRRGEQHHNATLTDDKVIELRRLFAGGMSVAVIAKAHNIKASIVHSVVRGVSWRHIPTPSCPSRARPPRVPRQIDGVTTWQCASCHGWLCRSSFCSDRRMTSGLKSWCKACNSSKRRSAKTEAA